MDEFATSRKAQHDEQQISVPFMWEDKPGWPKRDWRQTAIVPATSVPSSPVPVHVTPSRSMQVISIPFLWEERPGKPLERLSHPRFDLPSITNLSVGDIARSNNPFLDEDDHISSPSLESFCDSILLALPVIEDSSDLFENCDSGTDSGCENGSNSESSNDASVANVSILDFHFPLSSPDAGFLRKSGLIDGGDRMSSCELRGGNDLKKSPNVLARRTMTLGELIMLSRKLSRGGRSMIPTEQKHLSTVFTKKFLACF